MRLASFMLALSLLCFTSTVTSRRREKGALEYAVEDLKTLREFKELPFVKLRKEQPYHDESNNMHGGQCSAVGSVCLSLSKKVDQQRIGCCRPLNVQYFYKARVSRSLVQVFTGGPSTSETGCNVRNSTSRGQIPKLIPMRAIYAHTSDSFTLPVKVVDGSYQQVCSDDAQEAGTLHVMSAHLQNNLFHAINDNLLPFFSQVAMDVAMGSPWSAQPRSLLWAHQVQSVGKVGAALGAVPHMQWLHDATTALNISKPRCFSRVIWGNGIRLMYNHVFVSLRRVTALLLRAFLQRRYSPSLPQEFSTSATSSQLSLSRIDEDGKKRPLRIAYYSRGTAGGGRTLPGEERILRELRKLGAVVLFGRAEQSMQKQLELAFYADVVMGLHGAGLAHGFLAPPGVILVELKTLYAHSSDMFLLAADAASGVHAHVDISSAGPRGMTADDALTKRVVNTLQAAEEERLFQNSRAPLRQVSKVDAVFALNRSHGVDTHILGPLAGSMQLQCKKGDWVQYWNLLGQPPSGSCKTCGQ